MINRLTSVELQGFKTFATSTRFEFPGQITAIVGPNGSGKSNIADSIRWVLGEQSYSLLRAKRTDDMIFSGSQQRPRAGMASATITFNNEDGWLPIDYSEVSITRRAYRDGQNEYLLNGQKVRLKDISELLSQTGLSEMTYTIIGQGLVDVALALKPDERRKLFEEAAGIGLYRSRKEEALRRLENTRKNLDRVLDIMTEVKPRLRSLERQAARFTEYEQLRADLQILLRDWYGYHWHQKLQDVRNVRNAFIDQETRLANLRQKYAEVETRVNEHHLHLQEKRQTLETAHKTLSEYHQALEKTTRDLAILEERRRSLQQQKNNLSVDMANVQEEIKELSVQNEENQSHVDGLLAEYQAAADEKNAVEEKLAKIVSKKEAFEAELEGIRKKRLRLETESIQTNAQIEEMNHRLVTDREEREKIKEALSKLETDLQNTEHVIHDLVQEEKVQKDSLTQLLTDLNEKESELKRSQDRIENITNHLSSLDAQRAKISAQLDVLDQAEAALSGYSEGSKNLVEESRQGAVPAGIEPLSKYLMVEERFERAISAALGELTDLLVIPVGKKDQIIAHLESKDRERVALVPLDIELKTSKVGSFSDIPGFVGLANDLITVEPHLRQVVDVVFSNVMIVKDKAAAETIQKRLSPDQKAVTLNGLVFHGTGVLISGQSASGKRIGRTRKLAELRQALVGLERSFQEKQKDLDDSKAAQEVLEKDIQNVSNEISEKQAALRDTQQSHQDQKNHLTRFSEQIHWHQERLQNIESKIISTKKQISEKEARISVIDQEMDEALSAERSQQESIKALPVFEVQQALNHWQTHFVVAENALNTARQRFEDHRKQTESAKIRLGTYDTRMETLDEKLTESHNEISNLQAKTQNLQKKIQISEEQRIAPLTEETDQLEKSYLAIQKLEEHSHQQVVVAEKQYTQLQMELRRRNDLLHNIQQRIEDDFGLVSYDYDQKMDGPAPLPFEDGLIENLPRVQNIPDGLEDDIKQLKSQIRRIGAINPEAQKEYLDVKERHDFMTTQIKDLEKASQDLRAVIEELDLLMERDFLKTFKAVNQEFSAYFSRLFNGGEATLSFSDAENPVEGGVDIEARLPGRRRQGLALLSGGERSLTAVALIFALLKISPTPFCVLDEVDAMLDESNVGRFIELLEELSSKSQFILITHNRNTVQAADVIYGITMSRDSTSQVISLKLEDVDETYLD
jgi:chromosome segregation protein